MNILVVDPVHQILLERLQEKGHTVSHCPDIEKDQILREIPAYEGIVLRSKLKIDRELLDRARALRFIGRVGSGMENIAVGLARQKNIICLNSPEGNRHAVGEHALGLLLAMINKIPLANCQVKAGHWDREANRGSEIMGRNIGIIGYGHTGSAFAEKLAGLGASVMAYDKYKFNYAGARVQEKTLEALFDQADVLSLHVPLTHETRYMVDESFLKRFRKPLMLINTSRGEVIKTSDLVKQLEKGKVRAAALDVLEYESKTFENLHQQKDLPASFSKLTQMDQVILTPHVAGWTHESFRKVAEIIANKILHHFGPSDPH
jgi:D-3-phosphoglycerate dehydrogenase